jgi:hypothetical protein
MERNPRRRNAYEVAYLRLLLGDVDRAFDLLIAACEERTPSAWQTRITLSRR